MSEDNIIKNKEWNLAWRIANDTDTSLFLTGKAGTGKTTFLRQLKEHTRKRTVVLAPTGIAAINAQGVTIHSFFQLPFSPFIPGMATETQSHYRFSKEKLKIIRGADLIVIDEISMVRADLLDAVDDALKRFRRNNAPFGGVQMLLIGDLQQLAPVAKESEWSLLSQYYDSPYFFDSNALKQTSYATVELKTVFRQDDEKFISILNKIRDNKADRETLAELNKRYIPDFKPKPEEGYINLTTHNAYTQSINERELDSLKGEVFTFKAQVEGNYPEYSYPTDKDLTLKLGAQVMFVKNDTSGKHQFYNGMIGEIYAISQNGFSVRAKESGENIDVGRETWQNCKYKIDDETKEIVEDVDGTFSQYPVKLAWAITIHKSQGLTFSHAIIDVHSSFAHGQTYVALSRCKTLEGLVLSAPISQNAIISDNRVCGYTQEIDRHTPDEKLLAAMHQRYVINLISELFSFKQLEISLAVMTRLLDEHLYRTYPRLLNEYKNMQKPFQENIMEVSRRFHAQYEKMATEDSGGGSISESLQERITKGAKYFLKALIPVADLYRKTDIPTKNKQIKKQADNAKEALADALYMKTNMLKFAASERFSSETYLEAKANILLGNAINSKRQSEKPITKKANAADDNLHPVLLNRLIGWRTRKMQEEGLPAYCIFSQKAIVGISNTTPLTKEELMQIPGIGKAKAEKYGDDIIRAIKDFLEGRP